MPATHTQVYLTAEQRRRIDDLSDRHGVTLAEVVRRALDRYLDEFYPSSDEALASTFGALPSIEAPSRGEWHRA